MTDFPDETTRSMKAFARSLSSGEPQHDDDDDTTLHDSLVRKQIHAASELPPPTAQEVPALIVDLLSDDDTQWQCAAARLKNGGAHAKIAIVRLLDDPGFEWNQPQSEHSTTSHALRIVALLWEMQYRLLGDKLSKFKDSARQSAREWYLKARIAQGDEIAPALAIDGYDQGDQELRRVVAEGVDRAIQTGWATPAFKVTIAHWARANILNSTRDVNWWLIERFSTLSPDAARDLYCSDSLLSSDRSELVSFVLRCTTERGWQISEATLCSIIARWRMYDDSRRDEILAMALEQLFTGNSAEAIRIGTELVLLNSPAPGHSLIRFIMNRAGIAVPFRDSKVNQNSKSNADPQIVQDVTDAWELDSEVKNGGFSQYFFNSGGDRWIEARDALRRIGGTRAANLLDKAAMHVQPGGPSRDRDKRIAQYAKLSDTEEVYLDELSDEFLDCGLEVLLVRTMLTHQHLFRQDSVTKRD